MYHFKLVLNYASMSKIVFPLLDSSCKTMLKINSCSFTQPKLIKNKVTHKSCNIYYTLSVIVWVWGQHINCWTWTAEGENVAWDQNNLYVARIPVKICLVFPSLKLYALNNACDTIFRIIPNDNSFCTKLRLFPFCWVRTKFY